MHALSFEQLQRLLARESPAQEVSKKLSPPRTFELVHRWVQGDLAIYKRVPYDPSGWVHLTAEGLRLVHLPFGADEPKKGFLSHVCWVNDVRLHLEEETPALRWISERLMQSEQRSRQAGGKIGHIPDGVVLLPASDGTWTPITIEVQVSKPSRSDVRRALADPGLSGWNHYPLRYYVSREARGVVRATTTKMLAQREVQRPWVDIIDLGTVHQ